jgi:hypothetical protein
MLRHGIQHPGRRRYIDPADMERARRSAIEFRAIPKARTGASCRATRIRRLNVRFRGAATIG